MVKYLDNKPSGFRQWNAARDGENKKSWLSSFLWWFAIFVACWWLIGIWMRPAADKNVATTDAPAPMDISAVPVSEISADKIKYDVQGLRVSNVSLNDFVANAAGDARVVLLPADQGAFTEVGLLSQNTIVPAANTKWNVAGDDMVWRNSAGVEFRRNITTDWPIPLKTTAPPPSPSRRMRAWCVLMRTPRRPVFIPGLLHMQTMTWNTKAGAR